jgi:Flp pilus assembly protein TadG
MKGSRKSRNQKGVSLTMLILGLAFVIMPIIGLFAFEIGRLQIAHQELQNVTDAAALAAVATLTCEETTDPATAHQNAIATAVNLFKQNSIIGIPLTNTTISGSINSSPGPGEATLYFEFIDPVTHSVVSMSDPNGKVVKVYSVFGAAPAFGTFLSLSNFGIKTIAFGAVPTLDLVLCFDTSGSIDDQTPVTFVKRSWDATLGKIVYEVPTGANGIARGKQYDIMLPGPNGTSLNGIYPHIASDAYYNAQLWFSEYLAQYYGVPGLRSLSGGAAEAGSPPGNYPPGTAPTYPGWAVFTDVVVNLDGNNNFSGFNGNGYSFPNVATMVEAARGNLENSTVFNNSKANTSVSVSPSPGYQQAYFNLAKSKLQPLQDAKSAAQIFIDILNTDTDAHFGFVAFDHQIGANPTSVETRYAIDDAAAYGASTGFPLPVIPLDPTAGARHYGETDAAIVSCVPLGGTNIGAAVDKAVDEFTAHGRLGSKKAIVLFTDGQPTYGGPLDGDPWSNARKAAVKAKNAGVAIYTIGLAQNPDIVPGQTAILNDTNNNETTGGMAAIAGNGGTFSLVTNSGNLRRVFEQIARHLVELVHSD